MANLPSPFSPWCHCSAKRVFDVLCSAVMLVLAFPIMLLTAAVIRISSSGPIFFRHERLGRNGISISVLKFRTMVHRSTDGGPGVTRAGDSRVTPVGRLLRKWKVDELPQLLNVIRGDMSMVGPRPDLAKYFARLTPDERHILVLTPGITSPATLTFGHEEQLLRGVEPREVEDFYCTCILPQKVALEAEYAVRASFLSDVGVLLRTAAAIAVSNEKEMKLRNGISPNEIDSHASGRRSLSRERGI